MDPDRRKWHTSAEFGKFHQEMMDTHAALIKEIPEEKIDIYRSKKLPKWQKHKRR